MLRTRCAGRSRDARGASPTTASVGPSRSAKPSLDWNPCTVSARPAAAATPPATIQRARRPRRGGSARSRIARMMLSRLTWRLVKTIVASATAKAAANDSARLDGSIVKNRSNWLCSVAKMRAESATRPAPSAMPAATPSAVAASAYSQPSVANAPTSSDRRIPTARTVPSSVFRSAASMTKRLTSSSSPASTPKLPIAVNIEVNDSPIASAASSIRCLTGKISGSRPAPATAARTWATAASVRAAPEVTPPVFETATLQAGGTRSSTRERTSSSVAGETSTLFASCSAPSQNPAMPRLGRTRSTASRTRIPAMCTAIRLPGETPSIRARSLLTTA